MIWRFLVTSRSSSSKEFHSAIARYRMMTVDADRGIQHSSTNQGHLGRAEMHAQNDRTFVGTVNLPGEHGEHVHEVIITRKKRRFLPDTYEGSFCHGKELHGEGEPLHNGTWHGVGF